MFRKMQIDDLEIKYAKRNNILFVLRIVSNLSINDFKIVKEEKNLKLTIKSLHATKSQVRI